MPSRLSKRPTDPNQLAHFIAKQVTEPAEVPAKNPAAVALGLLGGRKGGLARAKNLTKKRRAEIAKKAARARWQSGKKS